MVSPDRLSPPTRDEVIGVLDDVLTGRTSRDAASRWAMQWVAGRDAAIEDSAMWEALTRLGMIDLDHGDETGTELYSAEQIADWRDA